MALAGRTPPPRPGGTKCSVGALLDQLDPAERGALATMMADTRWTGPAIYEACQDEGYEVARTAIQHHRRGDCACIR